MKKDKRNAIAWKFALLEMERKGVETFDPKKVKKGVKRFAKALGISKQDAYDFAKEVVETSTKNALAFNVKRKKKK
jgi:hypothetical protein